MNKFNLSFKGEIQPGFEPRQVKARFGKLFGINDPVRLERFFTGDTVILRRNLERKAAAEYYSKLRKLGVEAELVKVIEGDATAAPPPAVGSPPDRKAADPAVKPDDEAARQEAWETARREAEEEAARRKAEEEAARRKAEEEEARRKAEEEEARRKAEEEEARRKAERAEQRRIKAEKAARQKAEREAARRAAREETARRRAEERARKAEQAEKRRAEQEESRLRAAEEAAKQAAEKAERERVKAEEIACNKAAEAEQRRKAREAAERRRAERARQAEEERARKKAEREAQARRETEARERARQEQAAAEAEARARKEAIQREQEAQRTAMEEQAIDRAARELSRQPSLKPAAARVKTNLELPRARRTAAAPARKRQAGAPNLYSLRPFRNTDEVKARVAVAHERKRRHFTVACIALGMTLLLAGIYLNQPSREPLAGPSAAGVPPGKGPVLLAGDLLLMHDRAGLGIRQLPLAELDVSRLAGEMVFDDDGELIMIGQLAGNDRAGETLTTLLRCNLETPGCSPIASDRAFTDLRAFARHPLDGSLFLLDAGDNNLVRLDAEGAVVGQVGIAMPAYPVMRLNSGLLFMSSSAGPAISVFRYDSGAFGKQLDEILLMPPPAVEAGQQLVTDFLWNAGSWWVTLANADTGNSSVYRFDVDWNYLGQLALTPGTVPDQLLAWGDKVLVRDASQVPLQRFNAQGQAEAPLRSESLTELVERGKQLARLSGLGWRGSLLVVGLTALGSLALAWLQATRALVYRGRKAFGAQPIDELADSISWVAPEARRQAWYRWMNIGFAVLSIALITVAVGAGVSAWQLTALLLALGGAAAGLWLLQRSPIGHIGVVDGQLLLVDHADLYQLGADARLQHRGPFLLLDDVTIFTGNALLPAFSRQELDRLVAPLLQGGARVDRKTVLVKLMQARHPVARACIWALSGCLLAFTVLLLQWP